MFEAQQEKLPTVESFSGAFSSVCAQETYTCVKLLSLDVVIQH